MSTTHTGSASLTNNWGVELASVYLQHERSNDSSKRDSTTWYNLAPGATATPSLAVTYETGAGSPFDYWYVKFVTNTGQTWECKDNFYCSFSSSDNGVATIALNGSDNEMTISFSSSSGCTVSLNQV